MITFLVIAAVLLLGLGMLVGSSWTQQNLDSRFRQYATERRALNEEWRAVRELRAQLDEYDRRAGQDGADVTAGLARALRDPA